MPVHKKKKEPSKRPDQFLTPNLSTTSLELEELESEEVTTSSEPSDLKKETSTGPQKLLPEKQESSMSFTTPPTTSWSELKPSSRTVSSKLMPPHSLNGT